MDGLHMGRYFEVVQEYFHQPEVILGEVVEPTFRTPE